MRNTTFTQQSQLVAFRLPRPLRASAREKCQQEDITFSQLMRRAIRREMSRPLPPFTVQPS